MANRPKPLLPGDFPEFLVSRAVLMRFFDPPVGDTKFTQLVNEGRILRSAHLSDRYQLNESLLRLGLRPLRELPPKTGSGCSLLEVTLLALYMAAPDIVLRPNWLSRSLADTETTYALDLALRIQDQMPKNGTREQRKEFCERILAELPDKPGKG